MKFSGKLCAMIVLKVTKKQKKTVFEKTQKRGRESD